MLWVWQVAHTETGLVVDCKAVGIAAEKNHLKILEVWLNREWFQELCALIVKVCKICKGSENNLTSSIEILVLFTNIYTFKILGKFSGWYLSALLLHTHVLQNIPYFLSKDSVRVSWPSLSSNTRAAATLSHSVTGNYSFFFFFFRLSLTLGHAYCCATHGSLFVC